ncbi:MULTISPECIES: hypothetical protein [Pseudoalteromonas]|uniref:hypothetical protein n=1 Tax=Pseudoalteromonas TaxID=53246 RepID=UPI000849AA5F|nr:MULTISPECIES: hypothetical protein [Pseudoalteromonas]ODS13424.1 hypothetical protein BCD66_02295 [Pseudoalteromonas tetraodonis]TMP57456.1 hypothetical protein CWB78_03945 [Pseudoalteromonas sp. S1612]
MSKKNFVSVIALACVGIYTLFTHYTSKPTIENIDGLNQAKSVKQITSLELTADDMTQELESTQLKTVATSNTSSQPLPKITSVAYLPNIVKNTQPVAQYNGDLNNHQAYQDFHLEQQRQLEQRFVVAAKAKILKLEDLLAKGRQKKLSQEQLQVAIDKINALKQMQIDLKD